MSIAGVVSGIMLMALGLFSYKLMSLVADPQKWEKVRRSRLRKALALTPGACWFVVGTNTSYGRSRPATSQH